LMNKCRTLSILQLFAGKTKNVVGSKRLCLKKLLQDLYGYIHFDDVITTAFGGYIYSPIHFYKLRLIFFLFYYEPSIV